MGAWMLCVGVRVRGLPSGCLNVPISAPTRTRSWLRCCRLRSPRRCATSPRTTGRCRPRPTVRLSAHVNQLSLSLRLSSSERQIGAASKRRCVRELTGECLCGCSCRPLQAPSSLSWTTTARRISRCVRRKPCHCAAPVDESSRRLRLTSVLCAACRLLTRTGTQLR